MTGQHQNVPAPAAPAVPRILGETGPAAAGAGGVRWKLAEPGRQLDANVIRLTPGQRVGIHAEPDLDVLLLVLAGDGTLGTAGEPLDLSAGVIAWLPRGSSRSLSAGEDGLAYLTVHGRRPGMRIGAGPGGELRPRRSESSAAAGTGIAP